MQTILVKTDRRTQLVDVTTLVQRVVSASKVANGTCHLYVPHTTAAIAINECADPERVKGNVRPVLGVGVPLRRSRPA